MHRVVVSEFGGIDQLNLVDAPTPPPTGKQVLVRLTSIGLNHADLMARRGEYRLSSGDPPFTPGIEGGGVIDAVGPAVRERRVGQRVSLALGTRGTYASHLLVDADRTVPVPDAIADHLIGALWLAYLTAWGCLVWRQNLQPRQIVLIPAASSAASIAAGQLVRDLGAVAIGCTTSPDKVAGLAMHYTHIVNTREDEWYRRVKQMTAGHGIDIAFDPVAAGEFLSAEIRLLAPGGTVWIYGLLGEPDVVNVHPLIIKRGSIRGYLNNELESDPIALEAGYRYVLDRLADRRFVLPVAQRFKLRDVRRAHQTMERGSHIGKLILEP